MESIEVWMWVIAGLIIGILVFMSGSALLGRYLGSQELAVSRSSFSSLTNTADAICQGGLYGQETKRLLFPPATLKVTVEDADAIEGFGGDLCIYLRGQQLPDCKPIKGCTARMGSAVLNTGDTAFNLLNKVMGKSKAALLEFSVAKTGNDELAISWQQVPE